MAYYYISKFREQVPGTVGAAGRIIMPSGVQAITLDRRHRRDVIRGQRTIFDEQSDSFELSRKPGLLLDPQLYLATLTPETSAEACANLVGYPWFKRTPPPDYNSGQVTQSEYREQIKAQVRDLWGGEPQTDQEIREAVHHAITYQVEIGCGAIILPSPLTIDPGTSYDRELRWLDTGMEVGRLIAPRARLLATVAISDICTYSADPKSNRLLETITDHVTAREPDGVYLAIEQRIDQTYYISSPHTFRSIFELVSEFSGAGLGEVLVCWAGLAGFATLAAGAHGWASGWYRSERRLKLEDHIDDNDGRAVPAYYSHRLCGDIHPADLEAIHAAGLLHLLEEQTPQATELFRAIRAGIKPADFDPWTNEAARSHFNTVVIRETAELYKLDMPDRIDAVRRWLQEATECARAIAGIGSLRERTATSHQSTWRNTFERWATPTRDDSTRTRSGE